MVGIILTEKGRRELGKDTKNLALVVLGENENVTIAVFLEKQLEKAREKGIESDNVNEWVFERVKELKALHKNDCIDYNKNIIKSFLHFFKEGIEEKFVAFIKKQERGVPRSKLRALYGKGMFEIATQWIIKKARQGWGECPLVRLKYPLRTVHKGGLQYVYMGRENAWKVKQGYSFVLKFLFEIRTGPKRITTFIRNYRKNASPDKLAYFKPLEEKGYMNEEEEFVFSITDKGEKALKYYDKEGKLTDELFGIIFEEITISKKQSKGK